MTYADVVRKVCKECGFTDAQIQRNCFSTGDYALCATEANKQIPDDVAAEFEAMMRAVIKTGKSPKLEKLAEADRIAMLRKAQGN